MIMGSRSDWPSMQKGAAILEELGIPYEAKVMSAHRTPARVHEYTTNAKSRGLQVIIAGAGGAAHLAGVVASLTTLPVIGVPIQSKALGGMDSLLSTVQMPKGIPVATMAIGDAGAANAALYAAAIMALSDEALSTRLDEFRAAQTAGVPLSVEDE
jgi:5-(carboxyamino)imidazole ribonucleotide mutase